MKKKKWNKKDLEKFREIILEKRREIQEDLDVMKSSTDDIMQGNTTNAIYSSHMADAGTDQLEREKSFYWINRENNYIQYLNRALTMIDDGSFGICKSCGELISKERLVEVPHTTSCFNCKNKS